MINLYRMLCFRSQFLWCPKPLLWPVVYKEAQIVAMDWSPRTSHLWRSPHAPAEDLLHLPHPRRSLFYLTSVSRQHNNERLWARNKLHWAPRRDERQQIKPRWLKQKDGNLTERKKDLLIYFCYYFVMKHAITVYFWHWKLASILRIIRKMETFKCK